MRVTQARRDIRRDRTQLIVMTPSDNKPKKKNQSQEIYSRRFFLIIKQIKNNFSKKKISLIILILI
jgi:hypothetical protein